MYKILKRSVDYSSEEPGLILVDYGLFKVNYYNGELSSVDSDEPIGGWFCSPEEVIENNPDVNSIEEDIDDYGEVLSTIHENFKRLYGLMDKES